jgi:methionyl-tRNA formyltransferase
MGATQRTCYVIGEDNFTLACAKTLLEQQFIIKAICSDNTHLKQWAHENQIPIYVIYPPFERVLLETEYDFLFSILNSKILPKKVLDRAKRLSINFHNSLLPKYAGSHATSWCILNNESEHGVTWHTMSEEVDLGSILKQCIIPIEDSDTAISLNMKCTVYGLQLFEELLVELNKNLYKLNQQNKTLRTYHSKCSKPVGNALIDWNDTAENISCLFRACDYANYDNEFSLPNRSYARILCTAVN